MALYDYAGALKLGRKQYQESLQKGVYPYLPVLDHILSHTEIASRVSLGLVDIPLYKIVGTKSQDRTNAFANNFMPLLPEKSEFGAKWAMLYDYQTEEGIDDPILAYEFMNQFYVQEGNKRVSVMKYLGAYSIPGQVIRLIPKKTDDRENRLYYEFLDFYQVSFNCDVWFSREGGYQKLLTAMGKEPGQVWSEDERLFFKAVYNRFVKVFRQLGGEKLDLTASDAFLIYLEIYGYDLAREQTESQMAESLQKIWEEILLTAGGSQVELVETPEEVEDVKKQTLFSWFRNDGIDPEMLKIGFIYAKTKETSSWTYAHELGRLHLEQVYGGRLKTMVFDQANTEPEIEEALDRAVKAGCNLIFTTAPQMAGSSVRFAVEYPEIRIYNCSVNLSYSSVCTYYARMYESKFLMGAIAAAMSRENKLGYLADYPIYGTIANINAFALGARMINPYCQVYLEWRCVRGRDGAKALEEEGISFISGNDMITPDQTSREYGLYRRLPDGSLDHLATPIWHWGKFYERIVRIVCRGSDESELTKGKKAVNYWWGMSAEVIDVICSQNMPHGLHRLLDFLRTSIKSGSFQPFDGLIYSQNGVIRCEEGHSLSPEEIVTMNWLAENVSGRIPELDQLTDEAQAVVLTQGVKGEEET